MFDAKLQQLGPLSHRPLTKFSLVFASASKRASSRTAKAVGISQEESDAQNGLCNLTTLGEVPRLRSG